jgi:hypothetical protein
MMYLLTTTPLPIRAIKEARLKQMKDQHNVKVYLLLHTIPTTTITTIPTNYHNNYNTYNNVKLENIGKGHGQFRDITQDEFINEVSGTHTHVVLDGIDMIILQ